MFLVVSLVNIVTEALSNDGEMWGASRFHQLLASGASAQQSLDAVRSWCTTLRDDITLVVAKCVQS